MISGSAEPHVCEHEPGTAQMKLALALSGGGSRAMAFHLGCLRALHKAGLLDQVSVISAVSGGSVLAAMYCAHQGSFADFERSVRGTLARGFVGAGMRTALTTTEGLKVIAAGVPFTLDRVLAWLVRCGIKLCRLPIPPRWTWFRESPLRRWASRTTILRHVFDELFDGLKLSELPSGRPKLIIVACELRAKAAFYFTADRLHCWRYGSADAKRVALAQAVAASASYPLLLPALDESMLFTKNGKQDLRRVTLTDGGVYDNLGLSPFWPDRDPTISLGAPKYDGLIVCRADYGLEVSDPASFLVPRMFAVFNSISARAQNAAINRVFELKQAGRIDRLLLPYLGQDDGRLAFPPQDLVGRETVVGYLTNFSAMPAEWIDRLSTRGEQLTQALLMEHWPDVSRTCS